MEQVKFKRGTSAQVHSAPLVNNAFYYATDTKELFMAMNGELVPLDNSIYWVTEQSEMLLPSQVNKRIAYDFNTESLYLASNDKWIKVVRDATIYSGTLIL